jgi:uncharacterized membrane protein
MTGDESDPDGGDLGRQMVAGETGIESVVAHLYRGEVAREVVWRERLDATTNWAVTVIAALLAYAFSGEEVAHAILLVAMAIGVVFLLVEARRFQRYDVWRSRVRTMQENLFAGVLEPSAGPEHADWRGQLSDDYRRPRIRMPLRSALAHRLRRVYMPLLVGLLLVWLFRLHGADEPMVAAAAVSGAPGWAVLLVVGVGYVALVALAFRPNAEAVSELDEGVDRGDLERNG